MPPQGFAGCNLAICSDWLCSNLLSGTVVSSRFHFFYPVPLLASH